MLIKKNSNSARLDELLALRQKGQMWEKDSQRSHIVLCPSNTLNPEFPLSSVLVPDAKYAAPLVKIQKEDSEFSFKQRNELNAELPLDFDDALIPQQCNKNVEYPQQIIKFQRFSSRKKTVQAVEQEGAKVRNKATIGKLINPLKIKEMAEARTAELVENEERADNNIKKPKIMAIANCKFYDTLNKIKSLRLSPNHAQIKQQPRITSEKQRYSMTSKEDSKVSESKVESTDTSAEEGYPMRREIIMSIKKNVDRASLSPNREQRRRIPRESEESQTNSMLFYLNQTEQKTRRTPQEPLDSKSKSFIVRSANKRFKKSEKQAQQVTISYKTSILQLKELSARYDDTINIRIKIPEIFSNPLFDQADDQEEMFLKAASILRELQVHSRQNMTIRKYCNCIIVLIENLAIISYFSGHVYFGGWQQGTKNGLGLQWSPNKFVYYGQYTNGKRQGYGVFKDRKGQVLLGQWKSNNFISQH